VNAMVGLMATGGSTNHTIHLVAIAAAAGISIDWSDFSDLSSVVPLLASVYPNGQGDINQFEAAGGLAVIVAELLSAGLLHEDVETIVGSGLNYYAKRAVVHEHKLQYSEVRAISEDRSILRGVADPFSPEGGISVVEGNIGRAIVKVSALAEEHRSISAPARVFHNQDEFADAFEAGELTQDMVAVVRRQGPRANGMPELHKLSPYLGVMQNNGLSVALLTDGRMSGASGKILAAIQVTPEAMAGGLIDRIQDGDLITIDSAGNKLEVAADLASRPAPQAAVDEIGMGRELFSGLRASALSAEQGASIVSR